MGFATYAAADARVTRQRPNKATLQLWHLAALSRGDEESAATYELALAALALVELRSRVEEYVAIKLRTPYTVAMHNRGEAPQGEVRFTGSYQALVWLVPATGYVILPVLSVVKCRVG